MSFITLPFGLSLMAAPNRFRRMVDPAPVSVLLGHMRAWRCTLDTAGRLEMHDRQTRIRAAMREQFPDAPGDPLGFLYDLQTNGEYLAWDTRPADQREWREEDDLAHTGWIVMGLPGLPEAVGLRIAA